MSGIKYGELTDRILLEFSTNLLKSEICLRNTCSDLDDRVFVEVSYNLLKLIFEFE
jgi:hypothetical protein